MYVLYDGNGNVIEHETAGCTLKRDEKYSRVLLRISKVAKFHPRSLRSLVHYAATDPEFYLGSTFASYRLDTTCSSKLALLLPKEGLPCSRAKTTMDNRIHVKVKWVLQRPP